MNQDQTESKNANTQPLTSPTTSPNSSELNTSVETNDEGVASGNNSNSEENNTSSDQVTFLSVILSVIQASFGVQSQKNRERDFKKGTLLPFVITAVMFTVLFVLGLAFLVQMVIA